MTFEQWLQQERTAGRFPDAETARPAWEAAEQSMRPQQVYHDSRIAEAIRQQFSEPAERA